MANNTIISALDEQFKTECKVINLKYEYPGYTGDVKWAIISELTEEEILAKYPEQVSAYIPFLLLDSQFGEVRRAYRRNEKKFEYRASNCTDAFGYEEGITEIFHSELIAPDYLTQQLEDEAKQRNKETLYAALSLLTETQRKRLILYYLHNMSERDIAEKEGKSKSSIHESLTSAIKILRKFYETPDQNGGATGN